MLYFLRGIKYSFFSALFSSVIIIFLVSVLSLRDKQTVFRNNFFGVQRNDTFMGDVLFQNTYLERIENIKKVCKELRGSGSVTAKNHDFLDHILVDSRHRLLYCYVPKVACTNWKRIFMILTGKSTTLDVLSIPAHEAHHSVYLTLRNYTSIDVEYLLNNYTKFLFVRHPFERLLSAYRNKLEPNYIHSKYFQDRIGKYIIQNFRANDKNTSDSAGVSFDEFITYLINSKSSDYNEHWKPIHTLCEPCTIKYDFIGKYETLLTDANLILKSAGMPNLTFPFVPRTSSTSKQLRKYFSTVSSEKMSHLYNIYKKDFKMFSYNLIDLFGYEMA